MPMDGRDADDAALDASELDDDGDPAALAATAAGTDAAPVVVDATVDAQQHGQRLDRVAAAHSQGHSRSHVQSLIEGGHVLLDGRPATSASARVRAGQALRIELLPTAEALSFRAEPVALQVVHEDADVLVLDKPAGLVVHPGAGNWSGTMLNGLLHRDPQAARLPRAGIVHRLDKDTSGLMVVARTLPAHSALVRAIAEREVQRQYLALAHGAVAAQDFAIDAPIGRDPVSRVRMAVVAGGRPALTHVQRLAFMGAIGEGSASQSAPRGGTHPGSHARGVSALACRLHTGRTHQIRVHLASRGHPLVGDVLYGGAPTLGMQRQALHAGLLAFSHPRTGRLLQFESPPPADLAAAWEQVLQAASAAGTLDG